MITVVTTLFEGKEVNHRSKCFDSTWVDRLYRGISRNLSDFRFVCLVDQSYTFEEPVETRFLEHDLPGYMPIMEIFRHDLGKVMFMGLDSVITGPLDELARVETDFAMIRDPNHPNRGASGVMIFPYRPDIWEDYRQRGSGLLEQNFLHTIPHDYLDDFVPGQLISYKVHLKRDRSALNDARIVYFHGAEKPHEVNEEFVRQCWI